MVDRLREITLPKITDPNQPVIEVVKTLGFAKSNGDVHRIAQLAAFGWLHRYNTRRRHSHLGQMSPIDYENSLPSTSATLTQAA